VVTDARTVLDRAQLSEVTLDDETLMREILTALIEDTARQLPLIQAAIGRKDPQATRKLAHYSKGACANAGARSAAAALEKIERMAAENNFEECSESLGRLAQAVDQLRAEKVPEADPLAGR